MEQDNDVIFVEEKQPEDPGSLLVCGKKDLFSQEEVEVEEILQPLPVTSWAEEVENSFREPMEEQVEGPVDPVHSPCSGESLPWEDSGQGFVQQGSYQSEQSDQGVWDYVQEAVRLASLQDTSNSISGYSYRPQDVSNCRLRLGGEHMLQDWFQPQQGMVWSEQRVFGKL